MALEELMGKEVGSWLSLYASNPFPLGSGYRQTGLCNAPMKKDKDGNWVCPHCDLSEPRPYIDNCPNCGKRFRRLHRECPKCSDPANLCEKLPSVRRPIVGQPEPILALLNPSDSGVGIHEGRIGIYLRYIQDRKIRETYISNLEIEKMCENIYGFLKDLNEFLSSNFNHLPLEEPKT